MPKYFFATDFSLFGAILILKAFCFGAIPDIVIELIVYGGGFHKQAVMTVAQWHRNQFIRGPKMDACLCDKRNILVLFWLGFLVQILFILSSCIVKSRP